MLVIHTNFMPANFFCLIINALKQRKTNRCGPRKKRERGSAEAEALPDADATAIYFQLAMVSLLTATAVAEL